MEQLYIMGYSEAYLRMLSAKSFERTCAYLMPHLKPGLRILDVGCGPGSISVALAEAIKPGELYGIDIEPSQVEMSSLAARDRRLNNVKFQVAEVTALPFEDGLFDIVHCNDVLAFVPSTKDALNEIRRVTKPGGLIACREIIMDSFMINPDMGYLSRGYAVFMDILAADDGHPQMGKDLPLHLLQAGLTELRVSASFDILATPEELENFYALGKEWFFGPQFIEAARQYGVADSHLFDEIKQAMESWYHTPGAMVAFAFGEALAVKP